MKSLLPLFCLLGLAMAGNDGQKVVAKVKGKEIRMEEIQTEEILALRRQLYEKLELAIARRAEALMDGIPHDDDPDHMLEHFRRSLAAGEIELAIDVPPPPLKSAPLGDAYVEGNPEAPVMILAFLDAQCPFCKEVLPILDRLNQSYRQDLAVALRHLPLDSHPGSPLAAQAMECAREQGKFAPMRNALLNIQDKQSEQDLLRYAAQMGMPDMETFAGCLREARHKARIDEDVALADQLGMDATPSFLIGHYDKAKGTITGQVIDGALSYEEFRELIDKLLADVKKEESSPKKEG